MTVEERARVIEALIVIPWWNLTHDAPIYTGFSYRFLLHEVHAGRLQAARVGRRREILTCRDWCDTWVRTHTEIRTIMPIRAVTR